MFACVTNWFFLVFRPSLNLKMSMILNSVCNNKFKQNGNRNSAVTDSIACLHLDYLNIQKFKNTAYDNVVYILQHMTMMFEVQDLAVASPATVSRCGMVYLEPSYIGLDPFVECWLRFLPENIYPYKEKLQDLFNKFMEVCVCFNFSFRLLLLNHVMLNKLRCHAHF